MGTAERIIALLTAEYGVDPAHISPAANLVDLGLNSLTMAELLCDLQDSFGIHIPLTEARITTLGDAIALTDRLVAEKGG